MKHMTDDERDARSDLAKLAEKVRQAAPKVWYSISPDIDWRVDLDEAAELCMDADRPVMLDFMSKEDYAALEYVDYDTVQEWAKEGLRGYF